MEQQTMATQKWSLFLLYLRLWSNQTQVHVKAVHAAMEEQEETSSSEPQPHLYFPFSHQTLSPITRYDIHK